MGEEVSMPITSAVGNCAIYSGFLTKILLLITSVSHGFNALVLVIHQ